MDRAEDAVSALTEKIVVRVMQELSSADRAYVQAWARESAEGLVPIFQRGERHFQGHDPRIVAAIHEFQETSINTTVRIIVDAQRRMQAIAARARGAG